MSKLDTAAPHEVLLIVDVGTGQNALRQAQGISPCDQPLEIDQTQQPFVILVVGINGAGKTTTIGKLAYHLQHAGFSVMMAAGDTFRAAAVEQLQAWGERNHVPVVSQGHGYVHRRHG